MTQRTFEITKAATFDAAHYLSEGPEHRPYRQLHGHSFRVEASVRGAPGGPVGWVADLADLDADLRSAAGELDHGLLNDKPGLEHPTLETLCAWFADRLAARYPGLSRVTVSRPTLGESCTLTLV
ncbi:MAG: 6-pyruvoyl tetrahydropterin synthase family protein [Phenylobacterium sp.]|uniref:6-pyruvoyl trahydropterin synthase family protein n=1 Tax=Phenylobacterium sp. TaxID=1871053 RepID=UPI0025E66279|nr:6-carboxytetrahydropterin synthase [Phenylobacterium sp.]MCA3740630.1 6-pyruvoyl tetrahydropterin synthase family protein [Phenylobacterium sp.]MCA6226589.1 6-pyruvoyl tetrahydropterin synthase family protein [Phenylobacterium sp.]MCA6231695.1 6-pyruvoyl tetrahydropterin synthase family protein [Phenylobacterium sp.]MCA6248377.1 6-pyruvoyl tetrahydropterin synthase family protein [Phenylobacterium sp.]MCA6251117.1 6-pyruvoyl tetrahydropterin synthase family protein [Phenylobacterium sp.]